MKLVTVRRGHALRRPRLQGVRTSVAVRAAAVLRDEVADRARVFAQVTRGDAANVFGRHARDVARVVFVEAPVGDRLGLRHLHRHVVRAVALVRDPRGDLPLRLLDLLLAQIFGRARKLKVYDLLDPRGLDAGRGRHVDVEEAGVAELVYARVGRDGQLRLDERLVEAARHAVRQRAGQHRERVEVVRL